MNKLLLRDLLGDKLLNDPLMQQALTHRSAGAQHNERLEFLGDAVLGMLIAEILYHELPDLPEGGLSRMRAHLVQRSTLADVAEELSLAEFLIIGKSEEKSGGYEKASLLADTFEAIIGALYLLKGKVSVKEFIQKVLAARLTDFPEVEEIKDAKSKLQEALQARGLAVPVYQQTSKQGELIQVVCKVAVGNIQTTGESLSKRAAEQQAAGAALKQLLNNE